MPTFVKLSLLMNASLLFAFVGCSPDAFKGKGGDRFVESKRRPFLGTNTDCSSLSAGVSFDGSSLESLLGCLNQKDTLTPAIQYLKSADTSEKEAWAEVLSKLVVQDTQSARATYEVVTKFERSLSSQVRLDGAGEKQSLNLNSQIIKAALAIPEVELRAMLGALSQDEVTEKIMALGLLEPSKWALRKFSKVSSEQRRNIFNQTDLFKILALIEPEQIESVAATSQFLFKEKGRGARALERLQTLGSKPIECKGDLKLKAPFEIALDEFRKLDSPSELEMFSLGDGYLSLMLLHSFCRFEMDQLLTLRDLYSAWVSHGSSAAALFSYGILARSSFNVPNLVRDTLPSIRGLLEHFDNDLDFQDFLETTLWLTSQLPREFKTPAVLSFVASLDASTLQGLLHILLHAKSSGAWDYLFSTHVDLTEKVFHEFKAHYQRDPQSVESFVKHLWDANPATYVGILKDTAKLFANGTTEYPLNLADVDARHSSLVESVKKIARVWDGKYKAFVKRVPSLLAQDFKVGKRDLIQFCVPIRFDLSWTAQEVSISNCMSLFPQSVNLLKIEKILSNSVLSRYVTSFLEEPFPETETKSYADFILVQLQSMQRGIFEAFPGLKPKERSNSLWAWLNRNKEISRSLLDYVPGGLKAYEMWTVESKKFKQAGIIDERTVLRTARDRQFQVNFKAISPFITDISCKSKSAQENEKNLKRELEVPWVQGRWNRAPKYDYTTAQAKAKLTQALAAANEPGNRAAIARFLSRTRSRDLIKWFELRAVSISPLLKLKVDSKGTTRMDVALVSQLDQFEQLLSEANFTFFFKYNFSMHFMKKIALAWGDEPRNRWPEGIRAYYGKSNPPTLKEVYQEMGELVVRYAKLGAFPSIPECSKLTEDAQKFFPAIPSSWWSLPHSLVERDIQMRTFALSQTLPVIASNLPGAKGPSAGGMIFLRELFFAFLDGYQGNWNDADVDTEKSPFRFIKNLSDAGVFRVFTKMVLESPILDVETTYPQIIDEIKALAPRPWYQNLKEAQIRVILDRLWGAPSLWFANFIALQGAAIDPGFQVRLLESQPEFLLSEVQERLLNLIITLAERRVTLDSSQVWFKNGRSRPHLVKHLTPVIYNERLINLLGVSLKKGLIDENWMHEALTWMNVFGEAEGLNLGDKSGREGARWLQVLQFESKRPVIKQLFIDFINNPARAEAFFSELEILLKDTNTKKWLNRIDRNIAR